MGTDNVIGGITVGMKFGTFSGHQQQLISSSNRQVNGSNDISFSTQASATTTYYKGEDEIGKTTYTATGDYFVTRNGLTYSTNISACSDKASLKMNRIDSNTHFAIDENGNGIVDKGEISLNNSLFYCGAALASRLPKNNKD